MEAALGVQRSNKQWTISLYIVRLAKRSGIKHTPFYKRAYKKHPLLQLKKYLILVTLRADIAHKQLCGCILILDMKSGVVIQQQDEATTYIQLQ